MKRCLRIGPYGGLRDDKGRKIVPAQPRTTPTHMTTTAWKDLRPAYQAKRQRQGRA